MAAWAMAAALVLTAPLLGLATARAPDGAAPVVLVVAPPWRDAVAVIRAVGGAPVGPVTAPLAAFGAGPGNGDFRTGLRRAGAWAVLDGTVLAALCGWNGNGG